MYIKVGDQLINPDETPVAIIFSNDAERKHIGKIIADMPDREDIRWFGMHPEGMFTAESFDQWSTLSNEDVDKISSQNRKNKAADYTNKES